MMDFNAARMIAMNTPSGTPPFYAAESVCMLRGIDPWGVAPVGLPNWQSVIVEQMCAQAIVEELWPK